jgi:hypothetical protein
MSTVKTNNVQVGQSGTATNNFTVYQPSTPDGTVRIGVGNSGATTLDAVTISNTGDVTVAGTLTASTPVPVASGGTGASTAATTRSNLSAAELGANSDITSLSGLTTALSIAQGGTGQITQQAAINALTGTQTNNRVLRSNGTNATLSQVALTTDVTGTLPVANGGTGAATLTTNNVILGNGTTAVLFVAPSTSGNFLTSNGTTWTSATLTTAQALTATAGAAVGAVGTYALLYDSAALVRNPGDTLAGATLRYTSCDGAPTTTAPAGTWRIMGATSVSTNRSSTSVWLRIS